MRALPVDCLRSVRGEKPEVPALPDGLAARRNHSGNAGRSAASASRTAVRVVVEAGGVEPPSEKARREETTCVAGSDFSAAA